MPIPGSDITASQATKNKAAKSVPKIQAKVIVLSPKNRTENTARGHGDIFDHTLTHSASSHNPPAAHAPSENQPLAGRRRSDFRPSRSRGPRSATLWTRS